MKLNRKGFTLVELLATILIIGLVIGFSIYGIIKVVDSSKKQVNIISESSLLETARIYSGEAGSDSWKLAEDYEAFCVTVGELANKGLIEKNNNYNDNDFVIVKRNKITLAIEKEEMANVEGSENNSVCTGQSLNVSEIVTKPTMGTATSYTDKIIINFTKGSAKYKEGSSETASIVTHSCLYGDSSSNVNREGRIEGNKCILENLSENQDYYVMLYMNTNHGSSVLANGNRYYKTADFKDVNMTASSKTVKLTYYDVDKNGNSINTPSHYFKSTIDGTSDVNVRKCTVSGGMLDCSGSTKTIEKDIWYQATGTTVNITYNISSGNIGITTRIYDGSNNFKENTKIFGLKTLTAKFYKNGATNVDGSTSEYVSKTCSIIASDGSSGSCTIKAPTIARSGWTIVGWNTSSGATTSSLSVGESKSISSDVSYYAITKKELIANFEKNGATSLGSEKKSCYVYNTNTKCSIKAPTITRSGWNIVGWNTSSSATSSSWAVNASKEISSNVTYYAITKKDLTAYFEKNGATSIGSASQSCTIYNTNTKCSVKAPTITRSGWTIVGWNTSSSATSSSWAVNASKEISSDVKYYAITSKGITVTFVKNGATSVGSTEETCSLYSGSSKCVVKAPTITRSGWEILGWSTSSTGTSSSWSVGTEKEITSSVTYYAVTRKSLTANFEKNSATSIGSEKQSCYIYNSNTKCSVKSPTITRSGWTAIGWNTTSSATTSAWNVGANKEITSNVTYYAVTKKDLTAYFEKNGADSVGSSQVSCSIYNSGTKCSVKSPTITRSGWTNVGWNTSSSATSSSWTIGGNKEITSNVTYYAITKKNLTAKFEKNGATSVGSPSQSCTIYNTNTKCSVTSPTITRSGWNIIGWNTSSGATSSSWGVNTGKEITSDVTYYAVTSKTLTASFKENGATSISASYASCTAYNSSGSCNVTSPTITRSGWNIVGWNTSSGATTSSWSAGSSGTINSDVTYYAITSYKITISFNGNGGTAGSPSKTCNIYNGNTSCSVSMPSATRSGYTLSGWGTSSSASSSYSAGGTYNFSANKTLYAVWTTSCTTKSGSTEFSASKGYKGRINWSNTCKSNGTSTFNIDSLQFMSTSYTNVWYYLDGYVYVNGSYVFEANAKSPNISVGWFYDTYVWYNVNNYWGTGGVSVTGDTVEVSFYKYNYSAFYFVNGNYTSGQFTISNGKKVTIDIS